MGEVVSIGVRGTARAMPPAAPSLSPADAALMGVMADLLRAVVRDRRITVSEVSSYDDPRGKGPVAVATIRVFGLAPLTVVAPTGHDGVEPDAVLGTAYAVAERLSAECAADRACARPTPLDPPLAAFEADAREVAARMASLAADPRGNAAALRGAMADLVQADVAHQLASALWGSMAAFGQTALWARGEISSM